jgi:large subunit ribosomal protein L25
VAHVVSIREEVAPAAEEAVAAVEGAPAEPEVSKKGKGEPEAAAGAAGAGAKKPEAGAKK